MVVCTKKPTKVFPNKKGIFDLSFEVGKGEVFGYLGPNVAFVLLFRTISFF